MQPATPAASSSPSPRVLSVDALRGFDMFWILGADTLFSALFKWLAGGHAGPNPDGSFSLFGWLASQVDHKEWEGMAFYDLIFPLFVFLMGVSIVFSLRRVREQAGDSGVYRRIFRRFALLFLLALLYSGGFRTEWPDIRLLGVLNRIALAYLFGSLLFVWFRPRVLAGIGAVLLAGYWALLALVPIPDVALVREGSVDTVAVAAKALNVPFDPQSPGASATAVLEATTRKITGGYGMGHNLANHLDARYLPGKKWNTYWDPEGLLSTIPAMVTCLLGIFAGLTITSATMDDRAKVRRLLVAGVVLAAAGWAWHPFFPVIKKIWTSSYVLVAGGYSFLLLALFHWVTEVRGWRRWCTPFVWVGSNAITLYIVNNILNNGYEGLAARFTGGSVKRWLDHSVSEGLGEVAIGLIAVVLMFVLARFLYQRRIFLRL